MLTITDNDKYLNFTNITLNWQELNKATFYIVRVVNTATGQEVYPQTDVTDTFYFLAHCEISMCISTRNKFYRNYFFLQYIIFFINSIKKISAIKKTSYICTRNQN